MEELIKLDSYPIRGLVRRLLKDKTTRKNILFASDSYAGYGAGYRDDSQMTEDVLLGFDSCDIQPRVYKAASEQTERTRKRAEVFTPAWIVNQMNNHCDSEWFDRPDVFNHQDGQEWTVNTEPIAFPEGKDWKQYVDSRRLEITCGEAPYIVSRYDTATGEIIPIERRIGILDRKLRIVNENAADEAEWFKWAFRAFQSVYGYEYQGDNLLIARINLLYTLADYIEVRWHRQATKKEFEKFLNVICWNFWQMDGMKDTPPYGIPDDDNVQLSLFEDDETTKDNAIIYCKIYDWRKDISKLFKSLKKRGKGIKFDFIIGNPPYQEEKKSDSPRDLPIYDKFMTAAYQIADKVILITPARFLFNAGFTTKEWNSRMLNDEHLRVLWFEPNSSAVFANTQIPGGVAVTYRDSTTDFGKIGEFIPYAELVSIMRKCKSERTMTDMISSRDLFHYSELFFEMYPEKKAVNNNNNVVNSNAFDKFGDVFTEMPTREDDICFLGRYQSKRAKRYILREYIDFNPYISQCKVVFAQTNGGAGTITEGKAAAVMGEPTVFYEMSGFTDSFICVGLGNDKKAADNCAKYIRTKFMRALLATLKRTGSITKDKWANVPQQDFTENSDIDWSKPISEIDRQLYRKYGLTQEEIDFIETHVKEME